MDPTDNATAPSATILVVEDFAPQRYFRKRVLERAGFQVVEAASSRQALELAPTASLVLLDVSLPDGDGFDICERLKAARPHLPVVMITSVYRTSQARRDAYALGADAFLLEPIEPKELVDVIGRFLLSGHERAAARENLWIVTDPGGEILDLSADAAALLNISVRGALGRDLTAFFTENRSGMLQDLLRAAEGTIIQQANTLRPRDRRPMKIRVDVSALPHVRGQRDQIQWMLYPTDE
jgi:CheY-like chemotaxis protein